MRRKSALAFLGTVGIKGDIVKLSGTSLNMNLDLHNSHRTCVLKAIPLLFSYHDHHMQQSNGQAVGNITLRSKPIKILFG